MTDNNREFRASLTRSLGSPPYVVVPKLVLDYARSLDPIRLYSVAAVNDQLRACGATGFITGWHLEAPISGWEILVKLAWHYLQGGPLKRLDARTVAAGGSAICAALEEAAL